MSTATAEAADPRMDVFGRYSDHLEQIAVQAIDLYPAKDIRHSLNEDWITSLSKLDSFDPIRVVRTAVGRIHVSDGCHRIKATIKKGQHFIDAYVAEGTPEDAFRHSCIINDRHGEGTTEKDKRTRILRAMERWPDQSTPVYADLCGCSQTYVVRVQNELAASRATTEQKIGLIKEKQQSAQVSTGTNLGATEKPKIAIYKTKAKDGTFRPTKAGVIKAVTEAVAHPAFAGMTATELAGELKIKPATAASHLKRLGLKRVGEPIATAPTPDPDLPSVDDPPPKSFSVRVGNIDAPDVPGLARALASILSRQMATAEFRELAEHLHNLASE